MSCPNIKLDDKHHNDDNEWIFFRCYSKNRLNNAKHTSNIHMLSIFLKHVETISVLYLTSRCLDIKNTYTWTKPL